MEYGLYIHIPFCRQKCFYCDFPSYAGLDKLQVDYVAALKREISGRSGILRQGDVIDTVYLGGGTPTILTGQLLCDILDTIRQKFSVAAAAEITVEANPGTVDAAKLGLLYRSGVNRVSFGVQSFQDDLLNHIGRIHTALDARQAIALAREVGFENISLDLMYGLPKQTLADLQDSLEASVQLGVEHISIYGLKVEEGTVFAKWQARDKLYLPDAAEEDAMYEHIMNELPQHGYERYEISNFAKSGLVSRHNLKYWQNRPYIGIGAAAHSYYHGKRRANADLVEEYMQLIKNEQETAHLTEELDEQALMEEFCFLALRMKLGISLALFEKTFQCNIFSVYGDIINKLAAKQLLIYDEEKIYLTDLGMKYGNQVFCEFLLN